MVGGGGGGRQPDDGCGKIKLMSEDHSADDNVQSA